MLNYSQYKKKRKLLNDFRGVKIIAFQNDSISVALPFNEELYHGVSSQIGLRRFGSKSLKS